MGYRNYIGSLPREEYKKIKNFTKEELYKYKKEPMDEMGHVSVSSIATTEHYELGKYVDEFPKKLFKPVFLNKDLQSELTEEHDFYLVGKKFLEKVIYSYGLKVQSYYNDMLKPFLTDEKYPKLKDPKEYSEQDVFKAINHIKDMSNEWGCSPFTDSMPYSLERGDSVTTSCKYEYTQFELVRIYKTFDWKNNIMIYYGY